MDGMLPVRRCEDRWVEEAEDDDEALRSSELKCCVRLPAERRIPEPWESPLKMTPEEGNCNTSVIYIHSKHHHLVTCISEIINNLKFLTRVVLLKAETGHFCHCSEVY